MSKIEQDAKLVLRRLLNLVVPPKMKANERSELAQAAGISPETLRHLHTRQALNADTLIRLLLARGVSGKTITNLPQTDFSQLGDGEVQWLEFGHELNEAEKIEFVTLIKFIRSKWGRIK